MLYVYRRAPSSGARELAAALGGRRYRATAPSITSTVRPGDVVVCWGEQMAARDGVTVINGRPLMNKLQDALVLKQAGVATIQTSDTKPLTVDPALATFERAKVMADEFSGLTFSRTPALADGVRSFREQLSLLASSLGTTTPSVAGGEWVGRLLNHSGGADLLDPPDEADYWVKRETFINEYRIHSFNGKSIRAGIKTPREGATPHEWIRSYDGGWRISYDGVSSKQAHRDLAHQAVAALGLTFGAVDIGERADHSLVVLEVNRAPGLEGGTIDAYSRALAQYILELDGSQAARRVA